MKNQKLRLPSEHEVKRYEPAVCAGTGGTIQQLKVGNGGHGHPRHSSAEHRRVECAAHVHVLHVPTDACCCCSSSAATGTAIARAVAVGNLAAEHAGRGESARVPGPGAGQVSACSNEFASHGFFFGMKETKK